MSKRSAAVVVAALFAISYGPAATQPASAARGAELFQARCGLCHTVDAVNGVGPGLGGVVGRRAGSAPGYAYSAALKAWGKPWTAAELDRFLAAPVSTVPGTTMQVNVANAAKRQDLIAYLATLQADGR